MARSLWRAVGSLRLGVVLLIIVAAASTVGAVLPQPESFSFSSYIQQRLDPRSDEAMKPKEFARLARAAGILAQGETLEEFIGRAREGALAEEGARAFYRRLLERAAKAGLAEEELPESFYSALLERARVGALTREEWQPFYAETVRRAAEKEPGKEAWPVFLAAFAGRAQGGETRTACLRLAYVDSYGRLIGRVLLALRIHAVFSSPWFRLLCCLLIVNLVACSTRRLPAQWRAAFRQGARKSPEWYRSHAIHTSVAAAPAAGELAERLDDALREHGLDAHTSGIDEAADAVARSLGEHGFRVRRRRATKLATLEGSRGCLAALGGLWWPLGKLAGLGRLGSQVVHLGVVLVVVGGFISGRLSFRHPQLLGQGEVVAVPDVSYRLSVGYQLEQLRCGLLRAIGLAARPRPTAAEIAANADDWRERPGEPQREAAFRLRLRRFEFRSDPRGKPEYYGAHVTLLDAEPPTDQVIEVNRPLVYRGFHAYQQSYQADYRRITSVSFLVAKVRRADGSAPGSHGADEPVEVLEQFTVAVPPETDVLVPGTGLTLRILRYFPHWQMSLARTPDGRRVPGEARNLSDQPHNPAIHVHLGAKGGKPLERWVMLPFRANEPRPGGIVDYAGYRVVPLGFSPDYATWLTFKTHPVLLPVWIGCGVMMLGIFLCFYCNHERIWALVRPAEGGGCEVLLAGNAFKWQERFTERFRAVAASIEGHTGAKA